VLAVYFFDDIASSEDNKSQISRPRGKGMSFRKNGAGSVMKMAGHLVCCIGYLRSKHTDF
jgi:hypothetical protein